MSFQDIDSLVVLVPARDTLTRCCLNPSFDRELKTTNYQLAQMWIWCFLGPVIVGSLTGTEGMVLQERCGYVQNIRISLCSSP